jgi:hypothetical protein
VRPSKTEYRPLINGSVGKFQRHGFFVISRTTRWCLRYEDGKQSEWLPSRGDADALLAKWEKTAGATLAEGTEHGERAREEFIAKTHFEIVSMHNPHPFQVDNRKPTLTFPDGSTMQFEEGVPEEQIREAMEAAAREAHPDPVADELTESRPELESLQVWERELLVSEERRSFPDITSWDRFFPMAGVLETLDELSREGWSVLSTSEDRGLYRSDLAENASAPLLVRYLLVQDDHANSPALRTEAR